MCLETAQSKPPFRLAAGPGALLQVGFVGHRDGRNVRYTPAMPATARSRRRPKITATLDPDLLASIDAYVAAHPDQDRSAVIDEALRLWRARELERAMEAQFAAPDGLEPTERQSWDQLRRAAVVRQFATEPDRT
jgi:Arc/MetJ-type ribon-helix-helix transcriptional regulator